VVCVAAGLTFRPHRKIDQETFMKIRFAAALFALSLPLLAQDPAASEALFYKAYWLQNGERNFAEAMTLYDKFLQAAPEHPLVGRAAQFQFELLTRAGKTDEAKAFAQKYEKQLGKVAVAAPATPKPAEGGARPAAQAGGDNAQRLADLKKQLEEAKASGDEEAATRLQRQIARLEQGGGEAGAGGPGGRGARGGMFGSKKLTEMTAEELEQFKTGMERMSTMIERMKEANPEGAKSMEENFTALQKALDEGKLEDAQKVLDKVRESMPQRGGRGGAGGGGRGRGGEGGGAPAGGGGGGGNGGGGGGK
jgi:tetratricopeptide (TPR) repeat protein